MRKELTLRQYRLIDLFFFAAILCLCEALITLAATRWFPGEPYVLSVTPTVCAVVMFRWGGYAGIHAALGALVLCVLSKAPGREYLIYGLGNLLSLLALIPMKKYGWQKIRDHTVGCMAFGFLVTVLMQTGRAVLSLIFQKDPAVCLLYYTTDVLTCLFTVILMWITRRLDGILEEQRHYIKRVGKELNSEKESQNAGRLEL